MRYGLRGPARSVDEHGLRHETPDTRPLLTATRSWPMVTCPIGHRGRLMRNAGNSLRASHFVGCRTFGGVEDISMGAERISSFTRDGLVFDVRDGGPVDGTPVFPLHGFPQDSRSWDAVSALLHARGYRTIAPDQRGYSRGGSTPAPSRVSPLGTYSGRC